MNAVNSFQIFIQGCDEYTSTHALIVPVVFAEFKEDSI